MSNMRPAVLTLALALLASASDATSFSVNVTAWCDHSFRVSVRPTGEQGGHRAEALSSTLASHGLSELPSALVRDHCSLAPPVPVASGGSALNGNLQAGVSQDGLRVEFTRADSGEVLFSAAPTFAFNSSSGYYASSLNLIPGDKDELIFGLGQGNWTASGGSSHHWCAGDAYDEQDGTKRRVPLQRNGQVVELLQRKFHVSIPFAYSTAGYGFLFNMPGYGNVTVGEKGVGGMSWLAQASLGLDFWVTTVPPSEEEEAEEEEKEEDTASSSAGPQQHASIYQQYADATGHSPPLREDAMIFWQSRDRYKTNDIALAVAKRYQDLELPVGVLVVDFHNQVIDGDWVADPRCYDLPALSSGVRSMINASTMFSVWPEAMPDSAEFKLLQDNGCLLNPDLYGLGMDPTPPHCRDLMWDQFIKPRYYDQGVSSFWLDETDGEGTGGGGDGSHGYDTSYGPAIFASNLWINDWARTFTEGVVQLGEVEPLVLTRGIWAGGQRHGVVLWSSDVASSFGELTAQLNLGVHASLSGIPWWTSDVGGFGCGDNTTHPNNSTYMQELMVRWYQFGCFSPIFRTHGNRQGHADPDAPDYCLHGTDSSGENEVWSYGAETQAILESYIHLRASLKPYISALAANVSAHGVPTVRPLWWEFPGDSAAFGIGDQYLWGPDYLVAPVTHQGVVSRSMYFPKGASWQSIWDKSIVIAGGTTKTVPAPLHQIPVYLRV